jgi:hypothetical protein
MNNKLEDKHTEAISENFWEDGTVRAAAKACTTITIEFAKGFAEWMDRYGYSQNSDGEWEGSPVGIFTIDQLINTYIDTIK